MKDIVEWLITIEQKACNVYSKAALLFDTDQELSRVLNRMADDEITHYHIMNSAANHLKKVSVPQEQIFLDEKTKQNVEKPLNRIEELLEKKSLEKNQLIKSVIEAELSEWNDVFLYVVNVLKPQISEFNKAIPKIQRHLRYIQEFCDHNEDCKKMFGKIDAIPKIWEERILIVEDFEPLREIFKTILEKFGNVDVAENGEIAKTLVSKNNYSFIITDINMPVLGGIEFYKALIDKDPDATNKVAFMSGDFSEEHIQYFKEHGLMYKQKPISIKELKEMVLKALGIN